VSWTDGDFRVAQRAQALGGRRLSGVVVGENREAVVVQPRRVVGDVAADDQPLADADRLMTRGVPGREQQFDRAIAEQVVVAVDENDLRTEVSMR
jgi:hypothetical protein